ncbi:AAA family ATPase [Paenibacillus polymyxa]|nr:AAA family ATPase [Paenibacillus polymyxa]
MSYENLNIIELINKNEKIFKANVFENFIKYIKFPFYKNLEPDTLINFKFPLTVFVGENGVGKSSVLKALYGAPKGKSTGDFWFSTNVDPIEEFGQAGQRHCYFYGFNEGNELREVLKMRAKRRDKPDYWEPSKPVKKYNMNVDKRFSPITKNVIYLDFRSELSAFDQYFYFGDLKTHLSSNTKQEYLRRQSSKLKRVLDENKIYMLKNKKQNDEVYNLSENELQIISFILGSEYRSGRIVKHKLFDVWGTSVLLDREGIKYSEAHAGSGEIAIVKLVHELLKAKDGSLILLDEPEVSLHPGAQKRLKLLLLKLTLEKKHQIIISTHSSTFVENLPKEAIKLFFHSFDDNRVKILDECWYNEAFYRLGDTPSVNYKIQVEDKLAEKLVSKIMNEMGEEKFNNLKVFYAPGGASVIKTTNIKYYSYENPVRCFVLFDGDQRPKCSLRSPNSFTVTEANDKEFLSKSINEITNCHVKFDVDGNSEIGGRDDQVLLLQKKYLDYYNNYVYYFPLETPDEIIWDEKYIFNLIPDIKHRYEIKSKKTFKEKIFYASKVIYGNSNQVGALEDMLINYWIKKPTEEKDQIINILNKILFEINSSYNINNVVL